MEEMMPETESAETSGRADEQANTTVQHQHATKPPVKMSGRCQLLELPAELRNRIYESTFTEDDSTNPIETRHRTAPDHLEAAIFVRFNEHSLLRSCHQIREEATSMYYSITTFSIYDRFELHVWLKTMSGARQDMVKRIDAHDVDFCMDELAYALEHILDVERCMVNDGMTLRKGVLRVSIINDNGQFFLNEYEIRDLHD